MRMNKKQHKRRIVILLSYCVFFLVSLGSVFFVLHQLSFFRLFAQMPFASPIPTALVSVKGAIFPSGNDTAMQIKILAKQKNIPVISITPFSDTSYKLVLLGEEEVYISSQKSLDEQISSLQLILSRLTIEGKHFATLDLRFDKPVVVFK